MAEYRKPLLIVALALFVVGPLLGLAYCAVRSDDDASSVGYDDDRALVETWCSNVDAGLKPNGAFTSFAALAAAVRSGTIDEPTDKPPTGDAEALDRWQDAHPEYVSSSYVAALEGIPSEITIEWGMLALGIDRAHKGEPVDDPAQLVERAKLIDAYRAKHC